MKSKNLLFTIIILLLSQSVILSQDDEDTGRNKDRHWHNWKRELNILRDSFGGHPTISFNYGLSEISLDGFPGKFTKPNLLELKLGYTKQNEMWDNDDILNYSFKYLVLSNISTELSEKANNGLDFDTKMWRFGFGKATGYGYKMGNAAFILYHATTLMWSRVELIPGPPIYTASGFAPIDRGTIDEFNKTFRFGTSAEGGIRIEATRNVTFEGSYERSIIFKRHLFAKWAGSAILEGIGQSLLDHFVDEIFESSPKIAPVVNFVLKNALSYGIYELRQTKMNWPFSSEAPLSYGQFKFGLTFVF